jgi:hypothetical protein
MSKTNVTSDNIKLKNARLSFPEIWQPKAFEVGRDAKFQATFLLDPSDSAHAGMIKEIKVAAKSILTEAFPGVPVGGMAKCFGLADKHPKKSQYDGYKGMFYISTGNTTRPTLVDRKRQDLEQSDGVLYAGAYVNTNITLWTFDHPKGGQGVAANLRIIQFVRDGEAFGNAPAKASEELDDVELDDDGAADDWDAEGEDADDLD